MRVINIQIQLERVPRLDVEKALELFRKVADKSANILDVKIAYGPRKQYVNVSFKTSDWKRAWSDIEKVAFNNKGSGILLKKGTIAICEGQHSWKDFLLLHHFDKSKNVEHDVDVLCSTAYKFLKKRDFKKAFPWLLKAGELGDCWAQYHLGFSCQEGQGVRQDIKKAMYWYEQSALNGYVNAQLNLGVLLASKSRDFRKAAEFLRLAAQQGNTDAQFILGMFYEEGRRGIPCDRRKGFDWYLKAARGGHVDAQHAVGYNYHEGIGRRRDYKKAVLWYRKAAQQGNMYSMYNLGLSYLEGFGVPRDRAQAIKWLRSAAGRGHVAAGKKVAQLLKKV